MPKSTNELIKELGGQQCQCGKSKQRGNTFCRGCYFSLPKPMRSRLYDRVGEGYEEAYSAAVEFLKRD